MVLSLLTTGPLLVAALGRDGLAKVAQLGKPVAVPEANASAYLPPSAPPPEQATPEKNYLRHYLAAQACAKRGDQQGVLDALNQMGIYREAAGVDPDAHAQSERAVYLTLYQATLQSARTEIESHIGGGWRPLKRAKDPFIAGINRGELFARLDHYGAKAGLASDKVAADKKAIASTLYDYYQGQAMECISKFERGGTLDVDKNFEIFIAKMKDVGIGSGRSEADVNESARKIYSILFVTKFRDMTDYLADNGAFHQDFISDPLCGPKMRELALKAGMSNRDFEFIRDSYFIGNHPGETVFSVRLAREIKKEDDRLLRESGRTTTIAERLKISGEFSEVWYQTYEQWRKNQQPPDDLRFDYQYPDEEPFKAYNAWKAEQRR